MIAQIRPVDLSAWLEAARAHGEPVVLDVRKPTKMGGSQTLTNCSWPAWQKTVFSCSPFPWA